MCCCVHVAVVKQYDTIIYPEIKDKSSRFTAWYKEKKEALASFFFGQDDAEIEHSRFTVLSPYNMRLKCLNIFLEPYKSALLEGEFQENFDVSSAVTYLLDFYNCCACQYYGTSGPIVHDWNMYRLNNVSC